MQTNVLPLLSPSSKPHDSHLLLLSKKGTEGRLTLVLCSLLGLAFFTVAAEARARAGFDPRGGDESFAFPL